MTDLLKFYIEDIILKEEVLKSKFLKKRNSRQGNEIYLVPLKPSLVSGLLKRLKEFDILEKTKKGMNEYDRPCEK